MKKLFSLILAVFILVSMSISVYAVACTGPDTDGDNFKDSCDCNNADATIYPGAPETLDDGVDQDCNGFDSITCYQDNDQDGYGSSTTVTASDGTCDTSQSESSNSLDCDDSDGSINPGAPEVWYDGINQDCDSLNDFDQDMDGYVAKGYDVNSGGTAPNIGDCDDTRASTNPGAFEICGDGLDNNCNGNVDDADLDGDGSIGQACGGDDCDDSRSEVYPGAVEICGNGLDDDCNGNVDDADLDSDEYTDEAMEKLKEFNGVMIGTMQTQR